MTRWMMMSSSIIIGKTYKGCGYTKTAPRQWTETETAYILKEKEQGVSVDDIAKELGRSKVSVATKLKRLGKSNGTYNEDHVEDKYQTNRMFCENIGAKTVLDVYCGSQSWYRSNGYDATTNDLDKGFEADHHMDALKLCCKMYVEGKRFDIVDLDPFGSAYDCFDLAIKMARKGVVVTFGELGHKRWKRLDYVRRYYGIKSMEDFTLDNLVKGVQKIGARNKCLLTPVFQREWSRIGRVWFRKDTMKITEQWDKANGED